MKTIIERIAEEIQVLDKQVAAAIQLLDEGSTVPFIARYRKEVTGGLDDIQLRALEERLRYMRELDERRDVILKSIEEQGKLTPELEAEIREADTKTRIEDLYLPYKPKRRTKAQIAREAGLEPLALGLLENPMLVPDEVAKEYVDAEKNVADTTAALDGARQILMEKFAEEAELIGVLRETVWTNAKLVSKLVEGKAEEGSKFSDYFEFSEPIKAIPSHRALAMFRGRDESILQLSLVVGEEDEPGTVKEPTICEHMIAKHYAIEDKGRPADAWLKETVRWAWKIRIFTHLDVDLKTRLWQEAEAEAIKVFAENLRDLLLAAPAGPHSTLGLDPGLRTGVKVAVVDNTGKVLVTDTIYPHSPYNKWNESIATLAEHARKFQIELISIGNGTASRETDRLAMELIKSHPELNMQKIVVSEAGASVYSASELGSQEFPNMDVSLRGAVSIARRLQDPLAELVKIDPKSIGVGQYQHDINQVELARTLDAVVEDCVNAVGVDVNMASAPLLTRVAGLNSNIAKNIVEYRNENGAFKNRKELKKVSRLGEKTFEQCAGFCRIMNGENPLDASAVHPEAYPVVERIIASSNCDVKSIIGDGSFLRKLNAADFVDDRFGLPTVMDILAELEKPGRDPRPEFKTATFKEGVESIGDLQPGMILEGVVTNVANFGAFVDIGVHQDGLVHISALSTNFVTDPRTVVKAGDLVKVKVMSIDVKRQRISLSMRLDDPIVDPDAPADTQPKEQARPQGNRPQGNRPQGNRPQGSRPQGNRNSSSQSKKAPTPQGTLAEAFQLAMQKKNQK